MNIITDREHNQRTQAQSRQPGKGRPQRRGLSSTFDCSVFECNRQTKRIMTFDAMRRLRLRSTTTAATWTRRIQADHHGRMHATGASPMQEELCLAHATHDYTHAENPTLCATHVVKRLTSTIGAPKKKSKRGAPKKKSKRDAQLNKPTKTRQPQRA